MLDNFLKASDLIEEVKWNIKIIVASLIVGWNFSFVLEFLLLLLTCAIIVFPIWSEISTLIPREKERILSRK